MEARFNPSDMTFLIVFVETHTNKVPNNDRYSLAFSHCVLCRFGETAMLLVVSLRKKTNQRTILLC